MNDVPTGIEQQSDTVITISIDEVRSITKKLMERKYLLNVVNSQDSIIKYQDEYIEEEQRIVKELQDNLSSNNYLRNNLSKSLNRYKVASVCLGASLAISVLLFLIK